MKNEIVFADNYFHPYSNLEYCFENVLYQPVEKTEEFINLKNLYNSFLINNCFCRRDCLLNCDHSQNYILSEEYGELILNKNRPSKDIIYECSENCKCLSDCGNRLVQLGPRKGLLIKPSKIISNQNGLFTSEFIPTGAFICEYAGEILTKSEALKRDRYQELKRVKFGFQKSLPNYIICLKEKCLLAGNEKSTVIETFIDPSKVGNIGRYINHSCAPNCEVISVRVNCPIPKLAIFARRRIEAMEELYFHYGEECSGHDVSRHLVKCFCGSENCKQTLPAICY